MVRGGDCGGVTPIEVLSSVKRDAFIEPGAIHPQNSINHEITTKDLSQISHEIIIKQTTHSTH